MFREYRSSGIYAICNVEIEVDRLERNGGNVFGVPHSAMKPSPWTNVKPLTV